MIPMLQKLMDICGPLCYKAYHPLANLRGHAFCPQPDADGYFPTPEEPLQCSRPPKYVYDESYVETTLYEYE